MVKAIHIQWKISVKKRLLTADFQAKRGRFAIPRLRAFGPMDRWSVRV
jgi:hypothetical protein